jgi:hypothetical protein
MVTCMVSTDITSWTETETIDIEEKLKTIKNT